MAVLSVHGGGGGDDGAGGGAGRGGTRDGGGGNGCVDAVVPQAPSVATPPHPCGCASSSVSVSTVAAVEGASTGASACHRHYGYPPPTRRVVSWPPSAWGRVGCGTHAWCVRAGVAVPRPSRVGYEGGGCRPATDGRGVVCVGVGVPVAVTCPVAHAAVVGERVADDTAPSNELIPIAGGHVAAAAADGGFPHAGSVVCLDDDDEGGAAASPCALPRRVRSQGTEVTASAPAAPPSSPVTRPPAAAASPSERPFPPATGCGEAGAEGIDADEPTPAAGGHVAAAGVAGGVPRAGSVVRVDDDDGDALGGGGRVVGCVRGGPSFGADGVVAGGAGVACRTPPRRRRPQGAAATTDAHFAPPSSPVTPPSALGTASVERPHTSRRCRPSPPSLSSSSIAAVAPPLPAGVPAPPAVTATAPFATTTATTHTLTDGALPRRRPLHINVLPAAELLPLLHSFPSIGPRTAARILAAVPVADAADWAARVPRVRLARVEAAAAARGYILHLGVPTAGGAASCSGGATAATTVVSDSSHGPCGPTPDPAVASGEHPLVASTDGVVGGPQWRDPPPSPVLPPPATVTLLTYNACKLGSAAASLSPKLASLARVATCAPPQI